MKKALFFAGLAAAALTLVGCNKEVDVRGLDATPFQVVLSDAQTRTVNDGMHTKWAEGDQISLFHAEAGTEEYKNDTPFVQDDNKSYPYTVSDVENGVFQGTLMGGGLEEGKSYDWYVLYPFNSYLNSPVNTKDGRTYIGGRSDRNQVQAGYDSMAHLAGGNSTSCFPLYGIAKAVPAGEMPTIAMKHIASVAAISIKNDTSDPIKISQVEFTAPEEIVGNFFISFEKEPVAIAPYAGQVSATAVVTVTNPADLAVGETATVYLGIKPFIAAAGDKLSLKITTSAGVMEKELTLSGSVEFKAGFIKHLNVSYTSGTVVPTITISDIRNAITSDDKNSPSEFVGQLSGAVVSFVSGSNAFIQDETGGILYYKSGHGLAAGDVMNGIVSGKGYKYNGLPEIISLAGFEKTASTAPAPVSMTLAELLADYDRYMSVRVKLTGVKVTEGFTSRNTTMTDGDASLTLRDQKSGLTITAGTYDITGQPGYFNANQFGVWAQSDIVVSSSANSFDVTDRQISVPATATSAQIHVTGNVDWTVDPDDNIKSVNPARGNGEETVTVTFEANDDTENAKEYTVFLRTEASNVEDEIEVTITQAKADVSGFHTVTIDFSQQGFESGSAVTEVTADGVTASFDKGTNNNAPKYYDTGTAVRMYGSNSMIVTASGKKIVSIELTFGEGDGTNALTTNVPTFESPTWTGEAGSVTFTVGGTTGQRRIKAIAVKYSDETAPVTADDPTFNVPATLSVEKGKTAKIDVTTNTDGAITYTSANTAIASVADDGTVTGVAAGTTTITVAAAATTKYNAASAPVAVTVTEVDNSLHTIVMEDFGSVSFTSGVYTFVAAKASASNDPTYNASGKDLRIYAKGTLTVTNSKENMTKIVFNLSSQGKDRLAAITASTGTIAPQATGDTKVTWTGNANEVIFTVGDKADYGSDTSKNGQFCFSSVGVAPWSDGDVQPKTLASIEVSGQKSTFTVGDTFSFGGTVTAVYSDGSRAAVAESDVTFSGYDMSTAGQQIVTVTYQTKTATYEITVNAKPDVGGDAYTLVSALADLSAGTFLIAALNDGKYYAIPSTTISGQTFTCIEGVFDSAASAFSPAEGSGEFVLTAGPVDNSFYIYNTTLEKYLVATGSKKFGYVDNTSSDYGYWTFSDVSSGGFSGVFSVKHDNKSHYMRAYGSTVKCYDGASNNGIYLFKK